MHLLAAWPKVADAVEELRDVIFGTWARMVYWFRGLGFRAYRTVACAIAVDSVMVLKSGLFQPVGQVPWTSYSQQ